jgi:DNA-binding NarL/FixJ family response regulator
MVHKVMAMVFLGPRPEYAVIRHLDGDRNNNAVTNLVYGTPAENRADDVQRGVRRGENNGRAKLSEREVVAIRRLISEGVRMAALARAFSISEASVQFIRDRRNWRHLAD